MNRPCCLRTTWWPGGDGASAAAAAWASEVSAADVRWACSIALSRSFSGELYPVVDMANHAPDAAHGLNTRSIRMSIGTDGELQDGRGYIATRDLREGEELTDRYHSSCAKRLPGDSMMRLVWGIDSKT